jgi:hypothetical protein
VKEQVQKQKLSPLTSFDERERRQSKLLPLDEIGEVDVDPKIKYISPRSHRRRPGNSFSLAIRNFVHESKVLVSPKHASGSQLCATLC